MTLLSTGMSGCRLETTQDGRVRKTSPDPMYNGRLRTQARKQDFFSRMVFRNVSVPRVLGSGEDGGLFHFEMEYAFGVGMHEFLSSADRNQLGFATETLVGYVEEIRSQARPTDMSASVRAKAERMMVQGRRQRMLASIASAASSGFVVPKTMCHGDLTLANMIFHRNRVCLLDFLDSFVDTFLCDLAKLKQDLFYLWTPAVGGFLDARVAQACGFMWRGVEEAFRGDMDTPQFRVIDALNILRVEPYITTESQRDALDSALEKGRFHEDFDCSDGGHVLPLPKP